MFKPKLFQYNEETHTGTYNGIPIPSVTQLLDILYPIDSDIPQERLTKAATRGTNIHSAIETLNTYFNNQDDYQDSIDEAIKVACEIQDENLINYAGLLNAFKLKPFEYENLIFLLDENSELICYGHYDLTCLATKDIPPFSEGHLYMFDIKTTCSFAKAKTQMQLSIYSTAYEQMSGNGISDIFGLWIREGIKIMPLKKQENNYVIKLCKKLAQLWREKNGNDNTKH